MCCYFITFVGNAQGEFQSQGALELRDDVIHELMSITFEVLPNLFSSRVHGKLCVSA